MQVKSKLGKTTWIYGDKRRNGVVNNLHLSNKKQLLANKQQKVDRRGKICVLSGRRLKASRIYLKPSKLQQFSTCQIWIGQIRTSQVWTGQVRTGQFMKGQVMTG